MLQRSPSAYQGTNQGFVYHGCNYMQQYSHIYCKRVLALRPALEHHLRSRQSSLRIVDRIIGLKIGEKVGLVGTIFKEQKLKPCVLDEFTNDFISSSGAGRGGVRENYFDSGADVLFIEDESGRCVLQQEHAQLMDQLVTGVILGCFGTLGENGEFVVDEVFFPGDCFSVKSPRAAPAVGVMPKYLLLCSGVLAGSVSSLSLELLSHYVATREDICQVVIAGGVVAPPPPIKDTILTSVVVTSLDAKLATEAQEVLGQAVREADLWLAELASTVRVDLVPGEGDPVSSALPQQPLHACLFPTASRLATLHRATNPHSFALDGLSVVGHSGQPIRDAMRYVNPQTVQPLDVLQSCVLQYRHLAPTAPDTLCAYPFHDRDPFVLAGPNIIDLAFAGDCHQFATNWLQGTRFVCVPNFSVTKQIVLVDLSSPMLEATTVEFEVKL
ncbi:hypothetical protein BASA81_002943 [Batrachochytrium salamandrivorans]|nr:hypothetical protein BASA81_002943 [Batrachochytrium salamandrivorans]